MSLVAGVDVAANHVHCVSLDGSGRVQRVWLTEPADLIALVDDLSEFDCVAVDAPAELSRAIHQTDVGLSPKFRQARCAEIALTKDHRLWVPWVAPTAEPTGWIARGLELFAALADAGVEAIEVYPYAGYRVLAGTGLLPKKTTAAGLKRRIELLRQHGVVEPTLEMWSHDGLDALLAAVVARGPRVPVRHEGRGCDDSTIWLPDA